MCKRMVKSVEYRRETRLVTEMGMKRLNTWERKKLKRIYGPVAEQGMWITRTNQELREVHIDVDKVAYIKKKKLVWMDM